jgi:mannose-1-phosphate guanylyltransferase / mannose-6-phosphate isomerase
MLLPVILSGGSGTRLWPVSREAFPKPFIRMPDGGTLLSKTLRRASASAGAKQMITVTNREHYFITSDEYQAAGLALEHIFLLEPSARNTAPAVALCALYAMEKHGDPVLLILPADHLIESDTKFVAAVRSAQTLAESGYLVTFGIKPTSPETGFGYIECGEAIKGYDGRAVARFVEKPPLETAREFVASGRYLWNSGMFCFKASVVLEAFKAHAPQIYVGALACWERSRANPIVDATATRINLDEESFNKIPELSIDYAVMEKATRIAVVPCNFGWSDIGSWDALSRLHAADAQGNRTQGDVLIEDSRDCYVQSAGRMVAAVGVENLIVVDTPDALLIANRDKTQQVKKVAQQLKLLGHESYLQHRTVNRPWGTYTVVEDGPNFKIKRIVVKPGRALSLQMHHKRSEHWVVVAGTAQVVNGDREMRIAVNESTFIPAGHKHRLSNPGADDLVIIEVQTGSYLGEDDIVRFADDYKRV